MTAKNISEQATGINDDMVKFNQQEVPDGT
jgi:hypothetical protein